MNEMPTAPAVADVVEVQLAQLTIAAIAGDVDSAKTAEIEATLRSDDACMALFDRSAVRGKESRATAPVDCGIVPKYGRFVSRSR
jgi:hypothetical protein